MAGMTATERIDEAFATTLKRRIAVGYLDSEWPPYDRREFVAAIEAAVAEERARCAAIARSRADTSSYQTAHLIAQAIEAGTEAERSKARLPRPDDIIDENFTGGVSGVSGS